MLKMDTVVQLATTALALAFDLFVFAMTLSKAYFHVREMRRFGKTSILELILRDGACSLSPQILNYSMKPNFEGGLYFG